MTATNNSSSDNYFYQVAFYLPGQNNRIPVYRVQSKDDQLAYWGEYYAFISDNANLDLSKIILEYYADDLSTVKVGNVVQTNKETINDYRQVVTYTVTAENGDVATYKVALVKRDAAAADGSLFVNGPSPRPVEIYTSRGYHDVFFANVGAGPLKNISVRLEGTDKFGLHKYWTADGSNELSPIIENNNNPRIDRIEQWFIGKVRILYKEGTPKGKYTGKLIFSVDGVDVKTVDLNFEVFGIPREIPDDSDFAPADTVLPSIDAATSYNLRVGGQASFNVKLGSLATQATISSNNTDAVTVTPDTLGENGSVAIKAVAAGSATVTVTFNDPTKTTKTIFVSVTNNNTGPYSYSGGGGGSTVKESTVNLGGGGGSSKIDAAVGKLFTVNDLEALLKDALAKKSPDTTAISIAARNYTKADLSVLKAAKNMAEKAGVTLTIHFDTVVDGVVTQRLSIDPALATKDIQVGFNQTIQDTVKTFQKWFKNNVTAISLNQNGSLGLPATIAAKLPKGMKTDALVVYAYNQEANTYTQLKDAKPWVDTNGYLHFSTSIGGHILISDGKL